MSERRFVIFWCFCMSAVLIGCGQNKFRYSSAEIYYERAQEALSKRKHWQAQQLFQNLLSDFPGSHLVDDAQYYLGWAYFSGGDYLTATFEFERLLNEYPVSPYVDQARYQIGMCYYKQSRGIHHDQDETLKAIREFRRFIEDYPASEFVREAEARIQELRNKLAAKKLMIAENYMKWKRFPSVQIYCEEVLERYPDTDSVYRARFIHARSQYMMGDLEAALEALALLGADGVPRGLKEDVLKEIRKVEEAIARRKSVSAVQDTSQEVLRGPAQ